jgi:G:T/U-mismatch repair DNA glycosylase
MTHPFPPLIYSNSKKLLVGTLPPESAKFYFSNSTNTRLWDILSSLVNNYNYVSKGSNNLSQVEKESILQRLNLAMSDVIYEYERTDRQSVKDTDILPRKYNELVKMIEKTDIEQILFLYKSAATWFMHSLQNETPKPLTNLHLKCNLGVFHELQLASRKVKCILLPSPLNRGSKGQNLPFKLAYYKQHIVG